MSEKRKSGHIPFGQPIPEMQKPAKEDTSKKGQPIPPPPPLTEREDSSRNREDNDHSNIQSDNDSDDK